MNKNASFTRNAVSNACLVAFGLGLGSHSVIVLAAEAKVNATEVIQVNGIRSSLAHALADKQNASSIQDSIAAEDIGKFPDQNVAESLQRISGVSISRSNGEGSKVTVRGFGPSFNVVQLNARTLATTEKGRELDFQVLASELISGADVVKSPMGKTPEGSIGAYVNIKTARPLDNPGFKASGSVHLKSNELSDDTSPKVSGVLSNTFADETLGVLIGISHQESTNRIDASATNRWGTLNANQEEAIEGDIHDANGNVVTPDVLWFPGRQQFSIDEEKRERTGVNITLQWAPSDIVVNTFDYLYSDFKRNAVSQGMQIPFQYNGWKDVIASDNGTAIAATKYGNQPLDGLFQVRGSESTTQAIGFNSQIGIDNLTLNVDAAYSKSEATPRQDSLVPNFVNSLGMGNDVAHYDMSKNDVIEFTSSIDYSDPANARAHWNQVSHESLADEVVELKFDGHYEFDSGMLVSIDTGVAYSDREKTVDSFRTLNGCRPVGVTADEIASSNTCGSFRDLPDDLFSVSTVNDFLGDESGIFPRDFIMINNVSDYHAELARLRNEPAWPLEQYDETRSVSTREKTLSVYSQLNLEGEIGDYEWSGNVGLRYVKTDSTSAGFGKERLSIVPVTDGSGEPKVAVNYTLPGQLERQKSYNNLLPSINLSLDLDDGMFVRFAGAKVMSRPSIADIGVNRSYADIHAGQFSSRGGNPNLAPYEATQLDFSLEYYQDSGSAYAVNVFHKDIDTFISSLTTRDNSPDIYVNGSVEDSTVDLPGYGTLVETITQKENRDGGSITGVEVSALHYFDYLPGYLSGLGLQANYTYADSQDKNAQPINLEGITEPGSGLEGFAKQTYNVIAFYDKDNWQARIAYNWRGDFLNHRSGERSGGLPEHVEAYGQLDASFSYDITEKISVTAEAINLTNERLYEYVDVRERLSLIQYTGTRYMLGLRASF